MRFTITPLGSVGGRTVDQVVGDIVRYLNKPQPLAAQPAAPRAEAAGYYGDDADGPGRWLGRRAAEHGLHGEVDAADFAHVLAGRDPATGERLITARGSAGRRSELGVGRETRRLPDGRAVYDQADAAAALRLEHKEAEAMIDAGVRLALSSVFARFGAGEVGSEPAGSYLLAVVDADGAAWIDESELARVEAARAVGPTPEDIAAGGDDGEQLPIGEAARLAGVSARYLRRLAKQWESDRALIEEAVAQGRRPRRAYIVSYRGTRGQWLTTRRDLAAFVARRTTPAVRVGFDLTLTTEKSLGVLALLGTSDTRRAVLDAIQAGNDAALEWWERQVRTRVSGQLTPTRGWMAASFRHLTSRRLDPFPHIHNVVANAVTAEAGELRTLDSRTLYRHAVAASAIATVEMRRHLTASLGVRWRRSANGGWEIEGIPPQVLREFSQRRSEIDDAIAELEAAIGRASSIADVDAIAKSTRPTKRAVAHNDLRREWWQRARSAGLPPRRLANCTNRPQPATEAHHLADALAGLLGAAGITSTTSIFTRGDLLASLADLPVGPTGHAQPLLATAAELEHLADEILTSPHVVRLDPERAKTSARGEALYTTAEMLAVQQRIVDRYTAGRYAHTAVVHHDTIAAATSSLSAEQTTLVTAICASGHRLQCAIGRAGSGKTTAMRAAAVAWSAAGYRVVGAAVKGDAARHLGTEANIPAETLAWYLARDDPQRAPLDARTVLIVDEASTISDRDLDTLSRLAEATGAVVRLIGDPAQHGAVAAGGMFRVLCEVHPHDTPELREHRRLQDAVEQAAVDALRTGHIHEALTLLQGAGRLHLAVDDVNLYAQLLTRWWNSRIDGTPHPLVERSNHRRVQLNRLARRLLQLEGAIGPDLHHTDDGRAFAVGDEVIARRGDRTLHPLDAPDRYLRNGTRGVVTAIAATALTVDFGDLGTIEIPTTFLEGTDALPTGLDHSYALTSYAVQGATYDKSTSRIDERTSRAEAYVDMTRGRTENLVFATRAEDHLAGERLPTAPAPPLDASLAMRLSSSGPELTAWELAPVASESSTDPRLGLETRSP